MLFIRSLLKKAHSNWRQATRQQHALNLIPVAVALFSELRFRHWLIHQTDTHYQPWMSLAWLVVIITLSWWGLVLLFRR